MTALRSLLSRDLVVSDPSNTIRHRDDLVDLFAGGQVAYREIDLRVDHVEALGRDLAVVVGWEITVPDALPEDTGLGDTLGRPLRRRFTNVFRREGGAWRLLVKQSTITAVGGPE